MAPRSSDEDVRRRETVLTVVLLVVIALWGSVLTAALVASAIEGQHPDWPISLALLAVPLALYVAVRRGHYLLSAWGLVLLFVGAAIPYLASYWGTPEAPLALSALICSMTIVLAGILLDHRSTIVVALTVMAEVLAFGLPALHSAGHTDQIWPGSWVDIIVLLFPLGLITLASLLASRQVDRSLGRARASERALQHERDNLENTLTARTEQIRDLQEQRLREVVAQAAQDARHHDRITQYRRLHDTVLSTLTALSQGSLDGQRADVRARAAREADYVRRLLMGNDVAARGHSLHQALGEVIEDVTALGLHVDYLTDAVPDLEAAIVTALADATREALTNVVRHSGTRQAWLTATGEPEGVVVRVVDRGRGFLPRPGAPGLGLRQSIIGRMTEVGGSATTESTPSESTLVELRWPRTTADTAAAP